MTESIFFVSHAASIRGFLTAERLQASKMLHNKAHRALLNLLALALFDLLRRC
jgi:hypothetical protein